MTTVTIEQIGIQRRVTVGMTDLRNAYLEAASAVSELDLDDLRLWRQIDRVVAELTATAYGLTSAVTGELPRAAAAHVPPVVRVRELATAQRRLFGALNRHPSYAGELIELTTGQVRRLVQLLRT